MTDKLSLYNDALLILGERSLSSLSEAREPRRALDEAYDAALAFCLERGFWNHAMRSVQADSSASVVPTFGYSYAFTKPSDLRRVHSVSAYETMDPPLLQYVDETNYWYANSDPIYVRYVSDDVAYGGDLSLWPETYANYVAHRLAFRTCNRITGQKPDNDLRNDMRRALSDARSKDAMDEPPGFPPRGTWIRARGGSPSSMSGTGRGL